MKKYSKKILTKLSVLMVMVLIMGASISVYAMDSRVTASYDTVEYSQSRNSSRATGYITAKSNHYCSVKLFRLGTEIAYSGKQYGKGKVSNSTGYVECGYAGAVADGSAVYYGF